jgi:hypothetical protein
MQRKHIIAATLTLAVTAALGVVAFAGAGMGRHGPPQKDRAIDAGERAALVENAIALLDRSYVYPEKAAALAVSLRAQLHQGAFDSIDSAEAFADALTDALQHDTLDRHLEVRYFEQSVPDRPAGEDESAEDQAAEFLQQQRLNFGFAEVRRLHGNIGYLDIHQFGRPQGSAERIAAAMTLLADTSALIIDLRKCGGGDPDSVKLVASYLVDHRTHLNDIYWREENRTEERWTQEDVPGRKYGSARPLYVLTSSDTFSGGEDFAYALKNAGRAILVGETTGGGAHPGNPRRLAEHFMMFVPSGRPISPVTHTDWEGVGVAPDIAVRASKALDVAQVAVLKQLIAAEADEKWKGLLQETLAELE